MRGFVPTPAGIVDLMVERLFNDGPPARGARVLEPGAGRGAFVDGIIRWCQSHDVAVPAIVAVELDPEHVAGLRARHSGSESVEIRWEDFLATGHEHFDYVIGNPPYVPITGLAPLERAKYRSMFRTARGRFDLYLLFFEKALSQLAPGGRLVFITPEKYLYVATATPLRELLSDVWVEDLEFVDEDVFTGLVTYPLISTIRNGAPRGPTRVRLRDGTCSRVSLPSGGRSWQPALHGLDGSGTNATLESLCLRVSCGVATGADGVFVARARDLPHGLRRFAHPTVSGRDIARGGSLPVGNVLLVPYDGEGKLLPEGELDVLGEYLREGTRLESLLSRTCVARKAWYAFHETPPLPDLLRPKLLCKDIGADPYFAIDRTGEIVPRHSVYYVVPRDPDLIDDLRQYLNSSEAHDWLWAHCQRAAKGYIRLQSHVLKRLPVGDLPGSALDDAGPDAEPRILATA